MENESNHIRAFFAIDLPEHIKSLVEKYISQLKIQHHQHKNQIRWVNSRHLHLTLQFLAAVKADDIENLIMNVKEHIKDEMHFSIQLQELELFPTSYDPHIISIKISPHDLLVNLASKVGKGIQACGYEIERRPYKPHLTLARLHTQKHSITLQQIEDFKIPAFSVTEILFYKSLPTKEGSNYIVLDKIALK